MAYVPFQEEDQKQNTVQPQTGTGSALPTTGGGGGSAPLTSSPNQGAPQSPGFANINQYLSANSDQAPNVANTVASNLQNQYTGLQGDINNAANQAGEAMKGGSTAYDPNVVSIALSNPSQFVADPTNLASWQKQYNAAYTGPTAFENAPGYNKVASAANKANQTYQLGQTGGGYTQLLNQIEKNPTAGRTALDKALIQSDPNSQQTIQGALSPFKGIQDYVSGKSAEIGKQASDAATQTQETATKTREAAAGAQTGLEAKVGKQLQDTKKASQEDFTKMQEGLKNINPSNAVKNLTGYGLSPDQAAVFGNLRQGLPGTTFEQPDLSKYATLANPDLMTAYNTATPEDYSTSSALATLRGDENTFLPESLASQAGTAPKTSFAGKEAGKAYLPALANAQDYWRQFSTSHPGSGTDQLYNQYQNWQKILEGIQ